MRVLDLFSCVGGHALGLHAAGFDTVQFVERNEWRQGVLAHRFPGIPIHDDIRTFDGVCSVELVVGGPPCQRTSVAAAVHGYRTGESLWPEMLRVVSQCVPRWVVVEQPPGNSAWEAEVARGLASAGFHTSRLELSAESLAGHHRRRRVFLLAHDNVSRLEVARQAGPREAERIARGAADRNPWRSPFPRGLRVDDGVPGRVDRRARIEAIGDSNPPAMMMAIGRAIMAAEAA
jgi:DNA (cytosine-5)-methyltransferase 1